MSTRDTDDPPAWRGAAFSPSDGECPGQPGLDAVGVRAADGGWELTLTEGGEPLTAHLGIGGWAVTDAATSSGPQARANPMPLIDCASVPTSTASRTAATSTLRGPCAHDGSGTDARSRSTSSRTGHVVRWSSTSPHACSSE